MSIRDFINRAGTKDRLDVVCWAIVFFGVILRLIYLLNRGSFWSDESWVALNIENRSFPEMFRHLACLNDWPNRPLGFSLLIKGLISIGGSSELMFRLLPFVFAVLSLGLFNIWMKMLNVSSPRPVALLWFAISDKLIYFSAELKQYSGDVLLALVVFISYEHFLRRRGDPHSRLLLFLAGCAAILLTQTFIFILPGIVLVLARRYWTAKDRTSVEGFLQIPTGWLWLFIFVFHTVMSYTRQNPYLIDSWKKDFYAGPFLSLNGLMWLKNSFDHILTDPLSWRPPGFILVLFLVGSWDLLRRHRERFFVLLFPFLLLVLAGILKKYPLNGRLMMFTIPVIFLNVARGCVFPPVRRRGWFILPALVACLYLSWYPARVAAQSFLGNPRLEENRRVMDFMKAHYKPGDFFFMNGMGQAPYWYYVKRTGWITRIPKDRQKTEEGRLLSGVPYAKIYDQVETLEGKSFSVFLYATAWYDRQGSFRSYDLDDDDPQNTVSVFEDDVIPDCAFDRVWIYLAHLYQPPLKDLILGVFERSGRRLQAVEGRGASAYLYDLCSQ